MVQRELASVQANRRVFPSVLSRAITDLTRPVRPAPATGARLACGVPRKVFLAQVARGGGGFRATITTGTSLAVPIVVGENFSSTGCL